MTSKFRFRIKACKSFLKRLMCAKKSMAYKVKPTRPSVRELAERVRAEAPGVVFSNLARDIRRVTEPGEDYDAEFDVLWRGQFMPDVISNYSEKFLAHLVKDVIAPCDMDVRLANLPYRTRPDGRRVWEEV